MSQPSNYDNYNKGHVEMMDQFIYLNGITFKKFSMKKIFILLSILLVSGTSLLQGQKNAEIFTYNKKIIKDRIDTYRSGVSEIRDTLFPPIFFEECANEVFSFLNPVDWGFIGGTNSFGDLEKAQRFRVEDTDMLRVFEIGVFFADRQVVNDGMIQVKIYTVNKDTNGPGELVATSHPIMASEINIEENDLAITTFTFDDTPVVADREFFASIDFSQLYASNDTVSIFLSDIDCGDANDSWELFSDNVTWASFADPELSWNINSNLFMVAIVEYEGTTSVTNVEGSLRLETYPVPAMDQIHMEFTLPESSETRVELISIEGKRVFTTDKGLLLPGRHKESIDITFLSPGIYFAKIISNQHISSQRILIQK